MDYVTGPATAGDDSAQQFRYSDSGEGPAVVLLHGFPDGPESWETTRQALVAAGNRVVVPYLRGYHPDTIVEGRPYGDVHAGGDVIWLLDHLGIDRATLVGHDWGASAVWSAVCSFPERVNGIVPIAIPHPATLKSSLKLGWQARHFGYFKAPLSDVRTARNDLAYIDTLYERWAPDWVGPERDSTVARAKGLLSDPVVLHEALQWYRDLSLKPDPANDFRVECPGLLVAGGSDFESVLEATHTSTEHFDAPVEVLTIEGAGHWPHREGEREFIDRLITFVASLDSTP